MIELAAPSQRSAAPRAEYASNQNKTLWPLLVIRGALLLVFGALALGFPFATLYSLAILAGILLLGDGALSLWRAARRAARGTPGMWGWLGRGIAAALLGLAMLLAPLLATIAYASVGLALVACWFLITGLVDVSLGLSGRPLLAWMGVTLLLSGSGMVLLLLAAPTSFLGLAWLIGIAALISGATIGSRGLMLRAAVRPQP